MLSGVRNAFEKDYEGSLKYVKDSRDCLLLTMTWIYFVQQNHGKRDATQVKDLNQVAKELEKTEMDRYWLFCYEALSADNLRDQWSVMKRKNISFIRKPAKKKSSPKWDLLQENLAEGGEKEVQHK